MIEQTREEREVTYMRMTKKKLIQMLMNNQDAITDLIHRRSPRWRGRPEAGLDKQLGHNENNLV